MNKKDIELLKELSSKMGLRVVDLDKEKVFVPKSLDLSKPNRKEVKEFFQRQLDAIGKGRYE